MDSAEERVRFIITVQNLFIDKFCHRNLVASLSQSQYYVFVLVTSYQNKLSIPVFRFVMNSTSNEADFSVRERCFIAVFLFILIPIGVFGNALVVYAILKNPTMRIAINILLVTLAFSDMMMCAMCVPFDLITVLVNRWIFGRILCIVHATVCSVLLAEGIFVLSVISVDRYLIIIRKKSEITLQNTTIVLVVSLITTVACCVLTSHILGYKFHHRQLRCELSFASNNSEWSMLSIYAAYCYFIPLVIMSYCYFSIIRNLRRTVRRISCQTMMGINTSLRMRHDFQFKTRTLWTVFLLYIIFVFSKTPYFIMMIWNTEPIRKHVCAVCIMYLGSAFNPVIYIWKIRIIRRIFWNIVSKCSCNLNNNIDSSNKYKISITLRVE